MVAIGFAKRVTSIMERRIFPCASGCSLGEPSGFLPWLDLLDSRWCPPGSDLPAAGRSPAVAGRYPARVSIWTARNRVGPLATMLFALAGAGAAISCDPSGGSTALPTDSPVESATASPESSPTPIALVVSDPCHQGTVVYCVLNPAVTEATIRSTICVSGWTARVRPPTSYTEPLKLSQMAAEGLTGPASAYEEDHRVPLELGGSPADPQNLSPEAHPGSNTKDAAENAARAQVCAGADLRVVQGEFVARWLAPYPGYR